MVGGIRLEERASDLAAAMCIASALLEVTLPPATACIGEVALTGEIRPVSRLEKRIGECARLGYTHLIVPKSEKLPRVEGVAYHPVATLADAVRLLTGAGK